MPRITVYYTTANPHVQIELPNYSVGWDLVRSFAESSGENVPLGASSPEPLIAWLIGRVSPIEPYIAAFTERDRLSIGFRVRVIHAEIVQAIANQTAEFISSLQLASSLTPPTVVVEEAPPVIAEYIINGR